MTYEQLSLPICPNANVTASDFHAKVSALVASEGVSMIREALYSLKSCGWLKSESLQYCSQKMLLDCSTMRGGATFATIITTMAELGYSVEWQVLNSKDFGIPQHRQRVFIIGHYGAGSGREVFPIRANYPETLDIQRHIVANTLTTRSHADSVGTYIATDRQTDRQTDSDIKSERITQKKVIMIGKQGRVIRIPKIAPTLCSSFYAKSTHASFPTPYVVEYTEGKT